MRRQESVVVLRGATAACTDSDGRMHKGRK